MICESIPNSSTEDPLGPGILLGYHKDSFSGTYKGSTGDQYRGLNNRNKGFKVYFSTLDDDQEPYGIVFAIIPASIFPLFV